MLHKDRDGLRSTRSSIAQDGLRPDADHHDITEYYGLKLPRKIPVTKWSLEKGTAGQDPYQCRLIDFCLNGPSNYLLRLAANGRFLILEGCRNSEEFYLVSSLLGRTRDRHSPLKLTPLARAVAQKLAVDLSTKAGKDAVWEDIAKTIENSLLDIQGDSASKAMQQSLDEANNRAERLELEIRALRESTGLKPGSQAIAPVSLDTLLQPLERKGKPRALEDLGLTCAKKSSIESVIKKLNLTKAKKKLAEDLAFKLIEKLKQRLNAVEKGSLQGRIKSVAADWGFPIEPLAQKGIDYAGIVNIIASIIVMNEE